MSRARRRKLLWAVAGPLTFVMSLQAIEGIRRVHQDVVESWSSGKALAELLREPEYRTAIVLASNDYWLETEAYYSPNRMYFHVQKRFESHVNVTLPFFGDHDITFLLASADSVAAQTREPILMLVSDHDLKVASSADSLALRRRTTSVAALNQAIGDEAYHVLRLRPAADTSIAPLPY